MIAQFKFILLRENINVKSILPSRFPRFPTSSYHVILNIGKTTLITQSSQLSTNKKTNLTDRHIIERKRPNDRHHRLILDYLEKTSIKIHSSLMLFP